MPLGELSGGTASREVLSTPNQSERALKEAEEYVRVMSDQILTSLVRIVMERLTRGAKLLGCTKGTGS